MDCKQLSEFEKGQIVAYNYWRVISQYLQRNWIFIIRQLMFSLKILRKLEIIIKKKVVVAREKMLHPKNIKIITTAK